MKIIADDISSFPSDVQSKVVSKQTSRVPLKPSTSKLGLKVSCKLFLRLRGDSAPHGTYSTELLGTYLDYTYG